MDGPRRGDYLHFRLILLGFERTCRLTGTFFGPGFLSTRVGRQAYFAIVAPLLSNWDRYSKSPIWQGLKTLRNKVIAHSDLTFSDDKWRLIDPNELQFGVDDYDKIRVGVQDFLSAFHFAITGMHLNFDAVHEKAKFAAIAFWHAERS